MQKLVIIFTFLVGKGMKKSRNDKAFRDFYCCFTRECDLERDGEAFQILVE